MPSKAFRNMELANREQALKENGDYGLVNYQTWYAKPGQQQLSTSYARINSSNYNYTPKYSDSIITYQFVFQVGYRDAHNISHYRIYYNGSHWTGFDSTQSGNSQHDDRFVMMARISSWGAGVTRTIEVRGREYGGGNESHVHATGYWDGGGTDRSAGCIGIITEYRATPDALLDFGA